VLQLENKSVIFLFMALMINLGCSDKVKMDFQQQRSEFISKIISSTKYDSIDPVEKEEIKKFVDSYSKDRFIVFDEIWASTKRGQELLVIGNFHEITYKNYDIIMDIDAIKAPYNIIFHSRKYSDMDIAVILVIRKPDQKSLQTNFGYFFVRPNPEWNYITRQVEKE
jgi:hypothetical protein